MLDHELTYHKENIQCELCEFLALSVQEMKQHKKIKHGKHVSKKCDYCDYTSNIVCDLLSHRKKCKDSKERFSCDMCGKKYFSVQSRALHVKSEHSIEEESRKCEICDFESISTHTMNQHLKEKHSNNKCEYCDHACRDASGMRKHMKACKDTESRFVCEDCGKQYSTAQGRASHRKQEHIS